MTSFTFLHALLVTSFAAPVREDDVFDVMYYDDLGRFKRRITPFITWEPLPVLKPRG